MPKKIRDRIPDIPLTTLGTLCFLTIFMCQVQFKITKEINPEVLHPVLKNRDCWLFYTRGNSDRYKFVLKAVIAMTSPFLSLFSTGLLLIGKIKMNPYYFLPWILLTVRGLITIQTSNLFLMMKEMVTRTNPLSFHLNDWKWCIFYLNMFIFNVAECFAFYETFDLFRMIWHYYPQYIRESEVGISSKIKERVSSYKLGTSISSIKSSVGASSPVNRKTELIPNLN